MILIYFLVLMETMLNGCGLVIKYVSIGIELAAYSLFEYNEV